MFKRRKKYIAIAGITVASLAVLLVGAWPVISNDRLGITLYDITGGGSGYFYKLILPAGSSETDGVATISSGGTAPAAGSNTQVQFNDGGVFGTDGNFTWTKATDTLNIGTHGKIMTGDLYLHQGNRENSSNGIYEGNQTLIRSFRPTASDGYNLWLGTAGNDSLSPAGGATSLASHNIGAGWQALQALTTGSANLAIGRRCLWQNTTGYGNVALGFDALNGCTTGYYNVGVGVDAMNVVTSGYKNVAVGAQAMGQKTIGIRNTAVGAYSNQQGTDDNDTVAIGYAALASVTSGIRNVAVGKDALYSVTTGSQNVALGLQAGYWETGSYKLFIDDRPRVSEADARAKALVYGVFDDATSSQHLYFNANVNISEGLFVRASAADTALKYIQFTNLGGNGYIGVDSSTGGGFATGTSAYSMNIAAPGSTRSIHFSTNGSVGATLDKDHNFGVGSQSFGTSATNTVSISSGTAPSTSPADVSQLWTQDTGAVAGTNAFHMRNEAGQSGKVAFAPAIKNVTSTPVTLTTAEVCNYIVQIGTGGSQVNLPAGDASLDGCRVTFRTIAAVTALIDPNGSQIIELAGTDLGAGFRITNTGAAGQSIELYWDNTNSRWRTLWMSVSWTDYGS